MKKLLIFGVIVIIFAIVALPGLSNLFLSVLSPQNPIDPDHLTGEYVLQDTIAYFDNREIYVPKYLARENFAPAVLGESNLPKRIEVDLANQRVYAYEGDRRVYNFLISSGKWGRTPAGTFTIWTKLRYTRMSGGNSALGTYYNLPNVPYVMFFSGGNVSRSAGYSLHGTYWHSNFGHPMSHGCINMKTDEAGLLYYWANPDLRGKASIPATADNPGTPVIIYGNAPAS